MTIAPLSLTGFGSVTPFGPVAGLIQTSSPAPSIISGWPTNGVRRAFLVDAFNPAALVPGIKVRRLDQLSIWALVAASLALRDAGIDLGQTDRSRIAVVCATGFGCVELTESFFKSAADNGWNATDPIIFPETLCNAPAAHVALFHQLRGPNITVSSHDFAAQSALLQAAFLVRSGQADIAIVLAGDILIRAVYEWYEEAHLLSPSCFSESTSGAENGFVPSEGVVAAVVEASDRAGARTYAALGEGRWRMCGDANKTIAELFQDQPVRTVFYAGSGAPCKGASNGNAELFSGEDASILSIEPVAAGLGESAGLLHLLLALSKRPGAGPALFFGSAAHGGHAALRLEVF